MYEQPQNIFKHWQRQPCVSLFVWLLPWLCTISINLSRQIWLWYLPSHCDSLSLIFKSILKGQVLNAEMQLACTKATHKIFKLCSIMFVYLCKGPWYAQLLSQLKSLCFHCLSAWVGRVTQIEIRQFQWNMYGGGIFWAASAKVNTL